MPSATQLGAPERRRAASHVMGCRAQALSKDALGKNTFVRILAGTYALRTFAGDGTAAGEVLARLLREEVPRPEAPADGSNGEAEVAARFLDLILCMLTAGRPGVPARSCLR